MNTRIVRPSGICLATAAAFVAVGSASAADRLVPKQYATIQAAINASSNGDVVQVAPGTYSELIRFYGKAITVRATGAATNTFIDGGQLGTTVKFANSETAASVLEGFTISNGKAAVGGGMYINSASPTIRNCVISGNTALDRGAGVAVVNGLPTFTTCTFSSNVATERGGGAYLMVNSDVVFTQCTFTSNLARNRIGDSNGGAVAAENGADPAFSYCTFTANEASPDSGYSGNARGGAVWLDSAGSLEGCTFVSNSASTRSRSSNLVAEGGAVWASAATIQNCRFTDNVVRDAVDGRGGSLCVGPSSSISSNDFVGNRIENCSNAYGGALYSSPGGLLAISNCSFNSNRFRYAYGRNYGCAVYASSGLAVSGGTAERNSATEASEIYGGAFASGGSVSLINVSLESNGSDAVSRGGACYADGEFSAVACRFHSNTASTYGGAVYARSMGIMQSSSFTSNRCSGGSSTYGGAIYWDTVSGAAAISSCDFHSNFCSGSDAYGGAIFGVGGTWSACEFGSNAATTPAGTAQGGAVYLGPNHGASFSNCAFTNNNTDGNSTEGGAIRAFHADLRCTECTFSGNSAQNGGGACWVGSGGDYLSSFDRCSFEKNSATRGAGIYSRQQRRLHVQGSIFSLNLAFSEGGAIWLQGQCMYSSDITGSTFYGNIASYGGALWMGYGQSCGWSLPIDGCLFASNTANSGGAINNWDGGLSTPAVRQTTFCGNNPQDIQGYWQNNGNNIFGSGTDCNANGICDGADIGLGTSQDCNGNGVPDECDISSGTSRDVNQNGVPDSCETDCDHDGVPDGYALKNGLAQDCNANSIPDSCDIASVFSQDDNQDGVPDSCQPDCNNNGNPDDYDIQTGFSTDCNLNAIPDSCDIAAGAPDCNANGLPDACDIASGFSVDVNTNGIPDSCEPDCNGNGIPDAYELSTGTAPDCNSNSLPDSCDIASGAPDSDGNSVPDSCQSDCNQNGVPDDYELSNGTAVDCDSNLVIDSCQIANGASDINNDGVLDSCQCVADVNADGMVNGADLGVVISFWGPVTVFPRADLSGDGVVNGSDLGILLANWGSCN
jgi:predicted outer membrane repeat protein